MSPILTASHLTKLFGNFAAVDDISFELGQGEILGLLGVNGAGKTTTIQMLLGILSVTRGSIEYFGKPFQGYREEILEKVKEQMGKENISVTVDQSKIRPNDPMDIYGSADRLARDTGWTPTVSLDQTIEDALATTAGLRTLV